MIKNFAFALLASLLIASATARRHCRRKDGIPICDPDPPNPSPRPKPSPTPTPKPFTGSFTIKSPSMYVKKSDDGFLRGCADPRVYFLYARTIVGQPGSTITRNLGYIDYGSGRCDGSFIQKLGGIIPDRVPTNKIAIRLYIAVGIEEDDAGDALLLTNLNIVLQTLNHKLKDLETRTLKPSLINSELDDAALIDRLLNIPEIQKPSDGFLNIGHDFVGFNGLALVSGTNYPDGQPSVCSRRNFLL